MLHVYLVSGLAYLYSIVLLLLLLLVVLLLLLLVVVVLLLLLLLQVSGVLRITGAGLLLLRRLNSLKKLRLEQWTNTITEVRRGATKGGSGKVFSGVGMGEEFEEGSGARRLLQPPKPHPSVDHR